MARRKGSSVVVARVGSVVALAAIACGASGAGCSAKGGDVGATSNAASSGATSPAFVTLPRTLHPLARPDLDRGPLDPDKRLANLSLVFRMSPKQLLDRDALKAAQLDPTSPSYRKWLTPSEYAARFGANDADVARTRTWLASQGLTVHEASPLGARVTFSGSVAKVQSAFQTEMRRYEVSGEMHYAASRALSVPAELGDSVLDVTNVHDFHPRPTVKRNPDFTGVVVGKSVTGFAPPDWAAVYDVNNLYSPGIGGTVIDGTGVSIAVVGIAQVAPSDVSAFRTKFGLGAGALTTTLVPNTGAETPGSNNAGFEGALDLEWSGGIAKGASLDYVVTGGDDGNVDDATYYAIEKNIAPIISESWAGCDGNLTTRGYSIADQNVLDTYGLAANLLGITYVGAAGDDGATQCFGWGTAGLYVATPASFPGATAVGGTEWPTGSLTTGTNGYFTGYVAGKETTWNRETTRPRATCSPGAADQPPLQQADVPDRDHRLHPGRHAAGRGQPGEPAPRPGRLVPLGGATERALHGVHVQLELERLHGRRGEPRR